MSDQIVDPVRLPREVTEIDQPLRLTRADLMTPREVAAMLGVPVSTVLQWGREGVLPRIKLGRHVRFIRAHVAAALFELEGGPQ